MRRFFHRLSHEQNKTTIIRGDLDMCPVETARDFVKEFRKSKYMIYCIQTKRR